MPRRMILLTHLDVWMLTAEMSKAGIGNQSLYNTLLGYAGAGYDVHVLTTSQALKAQPSPHENITIHRRPIASYAAYAGIKRFLRRLIPRPKPAAASGGDACRGPKRAAKNLWRYANIFRRVMGGRATRLAGTLGGVQFVYGYEILGALAGEHAAKALAVPLVTRFQGTELSRHLLEPDKMLACTTHVAAGRVDADLVIMADDGTQGDKVLDALGVPKERYRFYMNGVVKDDVYRPDVDAARLRGDLGIADGEVFLLYAGRLCHWKRIDRMLHVAARARRAYETFKLVLIGDGEESDNCKRLSADLGLDDRVLFLGSMSHDEVMDYLNACDVYVSFYDLSNLSNSLIESCVCGKCIVTTDVGDTSHLLTDGLNGVVVPQYDDVDAIAAALVNVLKAPDLRARLGAGARQRGTELKTWGERMRMEVEDVETMLARTRG